MNMIIQLPINPSAFFHVLIPEFPDKDNYYYEPTEKLHIFDIATVIYRDTNNHILLAEDAVAFTIEMLRGGLQKVLAGEQALPSHIKLGTSSLSFSIDTENENFDFDFTPFWLWSSLSKIQTWLYTREDKIYLEISSSYPWLFSDPEPSENYYSFDEYVKNYKPIAVHEISKEIAEQWIKQSDTLLKSMERPLR